MNEISETKQTESVLEYKVFYIRYEHCVQPFKIEHCVTKLFISDFYGEFEIYDKNGRVLFKSKNGVVELTPSKLTTEVAKIWYETGVQFSNEYKELKDMEVSEIGMCFTILNDLSICFLDAPTEELTSKFEHIPVFYLCQNIYDSHTKQLKW